MNNFDSTDSELFRKIFSEVIILDIIELYLES